MAEPKREAARRTGRRASSASSCTRAAGADCPRTTCEGFAAGCAACATAGARAASRRMKWCSGSTHGWRTPSMPTPRVCATRSSGADGSILRGAMAALPRGERHPSGSLAGLLLPAREPRRRVEQQPAQCAFREPQQEHDRQPQQQQRFSSRQYARKPGPRLPRSARVRKGRPGTAMMSSAAPPCAVPRGLRAVCASMPGRRRGGPLRRPSARGRVAYGQHRQPGNARRALGGGHQ